MALLNDPSRKGKGSQLAQLGLLAAVPAILVAGPMIGYFVGSWADGRLGSEPYLTILGTALGFGAAGKETYRLIKRSQEFEDKKDDR
jgi:F0F1-type ATP synthase assembly protein I